MSFKGILVGSFLSLAVFACPAQDYDSLRLSRLPRLTPTHPLKSTGLPYKVDNSRTRYFPPIFTQYGYNCNQSASISMAFTYELNALRNRDAYYEENRLPAFFTWNMMNSGNPEKGVSYFESWDMVHAIGCPNWTDFGNYLINETRWMNGYYRYYRGMQNRVDEIYSLDVSTEEGLQTLKHWLYDHIGEYQPGGVANFQLATLDLQFWPLPEGTEDAGKLMIPYFGYAVGHAMTFVGYNDSVRYDFNQDGRYTNDEDTDGDGQVTMADWEIGALICVNTYGTSWGTEGRAYVPYRILPLHPNQGGIWMKSVVVSKPRRDYQPRLTLRARVRYPDRSRLWITAGVSQDPGAQTPDFILDQPVFHYQGGAFPMQGRGPDDPGLIEIGIDATPLLGHVKSGQPAAFFLVVCEQDPASASDGAVEYWSVLEYSGEEKENPGGTQNIPIDKPFMAMPVVFTPVFSGPSISTERLTEVTAGQEFQAYLQAQDGVAPYKWFSPDNAYIETRFQSQFPFYLGTRVIPASADFDKVTVALPFGFPYRGKTYHQMTLSSKGGILLQQNDLFVPYGFELREMLGLHTAIFPFYSTELKYTDYLDGVYYERNVEGVTVYWNASMNLGNQRSDFNFAARLYPNGTIEFYYGNLVNNTTTPWLIGLTGGSKAASYFPGINASGVRNGLNIRFQPPVLPEGLKIAPDGLLTCKPLQPGRIWTIPLEVEDSRGMKAFREITLATSSLDAHADVEASTDIRIFPNPVTERAFVQVETVKPGNLDLAIFDLTGKEVLKRSYSIQPGRSVITVDTGSIRSPGIYFVQLTGLVDYRSKIYLNKPGG